MWFIRDCCKKGSWLNATQNAPEDERERDGEGFLFSRSLCIAQAAAAAALQVLAAAAAANRPFVLIGSLRTRSNLLLRALLVLPLSLHLFFVIWTKLPEFCSFSLSLFFCISSWIAQFLYRERFIHLYFSFLLSGFAFLLFLRYLQATNIAFILYTCVDSVCTRRQPKRAPF